MRILAVTRSSFVAAACVILITSSVHAASSDFYVSSSGNVGIATTSPGALLDVGSPGATLGTMRLDGNTSGYVQIQPGGAAGSWTLTLPTSAGTSGYVLQTDGSGNSSWASQAAAGFASSAGQLQCSGGDCDDSTGSGDIQYCPYKGNVKTTASQGNYSIPAACLTATLSSMYVDGTASSSVSANTLYYIYLWDASGTWVLDAETTGHATDSTSGIEIMSGDDTKTLVGMIHTDGNQHVMTNGETNTPGDTNTVATWDNRIPTTTTCAASTGPTVSSSTTTELDSTDRCYFMSWGDSLHADAQQGLVPNGAGASAYSYIFIDSIGSGTLVSTSLNSFGALGWEIPAFAPAAYTPSEGFHFTIYAARTNGMTASAEYQNETNTVQTSQ